MCNELFVGATVSKRISGTRETPDIPKELLPFGSSHRFLSEQFEDDGPHLRPLLLELKRALLLQRDKCQRVVRWGQTSGQHIPWTLASCSTSDLIITIGALYHCLSLQSYCLTLKAMTANDWQITNHWTSDMTDIWPKTGTLSAKGGHSDGRLALHFSAYNWWQALGLFLSSLKASHTLRPIGPNIAYECYDLNVFFHLFWFVCKHFNRFSN